MEGFTKLVAIFTSPELLVGFAIVCAVSVLVTVSILRRTREQSKTALSCGWQASEFILVAGQHSGSYYDLDQALSKPNAREEICRWYVQKIREIYEYHNGIDRIGFIEKDSGPVGTLALKEFLVSETDIPAVVLRPRRRVVFSCSKGSLPLGRKLKVVLISDVITTGGTVLRAASRLQELGMQVPAIMAIYNRGGQEAVAAFERKGIDIYFLANSVKLSQSQAPVKSLHGV